MSSLLIVGAGHNGLIAAFYLARAGHKPIVLERRAVIGGASLTGEIVAGHRCPTLAHAIGPLRPSIVRDMGLTRRVELLRPDPRLVVLSAGGRALVMSQDVGRTADAIREFSTEDAARYPEFCATLQRLSDFLIPILDRTPPSLDGPTAGEVWDLLKTGRRFRALGRSDGFRLLRWLPMAVADLVGEYFTTDMLQAAIAARGIFGAAAGPWSAGTGAVMLLNAAMDPAPGGNGGTAKGGPGALARALAEAAQEAGATIRVESPVARILVRDGRAGGVALEDGTEIAADAVVSAVDPRRTFLGLVDPVELDPSFLQMIRNYRMSGSLAKVNLALSELPAFTGIASPAELAGRIQIGPTIDYLEKAFDASKYGQFSAEPYLDITIPSVLDPSLCPSGKHVMSICVQFAPYTLAKNVEWDTMRDQLGTTVLRTLEQHAPGLSNLIEGRQLLTPADLEQVYGLTRGQIFHGDHSLDQLFATRPVLGWAQYRTPIDGLFLCGAGTHPGGGLTGAPGRNAAREIVKALKQ
jgi:phytoene dehydrogenase-like protein